MNLLLFLIYLADVVNIINVLLCISILIIGAWTFAYACEAQSDKSAGKMDEYKIGVKSRNKYFLILVILLSVFTILPNKTMLYQIIAVKSGEYTINEIVTNKKSHKPSIDELDLEKAIQSYKEDTKHQ